MTEREAYRERGNHHLSYVGKFATVAEEGEEKKEEGEGGHW